MFPDSKNSRTGAFTGRRESRFAAVLIWVFGGTALGLVEMALAGARPEVSFSSYSLAGHMLYYWIPSAAGGILLWALLEAAGRAGGRNPDPYSWGSGLFAAAVTFIYVGLAVNGMIAGPPTTPAGMVANLVVAGAAVGVGLLAAALARALAAALEGRRIAALALGAACAAPLLYLAWAWGNIDPGRGARSSGPKGSRRPNVILVTIDALRADHLSFNGYERDTAPYLTQMANEGANFPHAFSQATITVRSMASLFTSLYPQMHGVMSSGLRISESALTLPEVLSKAGYATAGFGGGNPSLFHDAGIVRGYDYYDDCRSIWTLVPQKIMARLGLVERMDMGSARTTPPAEIVFDKAKSWLDHEPGEPFFLFVHLMDVHAPYLPPDGYADKFGPAREGLPSDTRLNRKCNSLVLGKSEKFFELVEQGAFDRMNELDVTYDDISPDELDRLIDLYDGSIAYVDSQLERFMEDLSSEGILDDTLVLVTADHGEGFLDHGRLFHSGDLVYDELMRVPLIIRYPKARAGGLRVDAQVRLIDIMPTLLEAAGLDYVDGPVPEASRVGGVPGTAGVGEGEGGGGGYSGTDGSDRSAGDGRTGGGGRSAVTEEIGGSEPGRGLDMQGRSLLPLIGEDGNGADVPWAGDVYCEGALVSCVRTPRWKYIDSQGHNTLELYDIEDDPGETINLIGRVDGVAREMAERLEGYAELVRLYRERHPGPTHISVDEETRKRLRALGYVE